MVRHAIADYGSMTGPSNLLNVWEFIAKVKCFIGSTNLKLPVSILQQVLYCKTEYILSISWKVMKFHPLAFAKAEEV